jgi:hypothetical protein
MAFINWGSESPEQLAIRRRFEEQTMYEQMVMMAQSRAGQAPGVGGGTAVSKNPKAIKIAAKNNLIGYYDQADTQNLVFFVADWDAVAFSNNADTGIPYADINNWYVDEMIDGKGVLVQVRMNNNDRYYIFIDAGGNIIETVHLVYASLYGTGSSRLSTEGIGIQLTYRNETQGRVVKWWNGNEIFSYQDNNTIESNQDHFYTDWYGWDSAFADGTGSVYIYDNILDDWRIFHTRPNGEFIEVTNSYYNNGIGADYNMLHCVGNFWIADYQSDYVEYSANATYHHDSYTVTLPAPIPGLRRGMEILGVGTGDFGSGIRILEISNGGLELTISDYPNSDNTDAPVIFNGSFVDTFRVMSADGSYTNLDISEYDATYTLNSYLFGSDKAAFLLGTGYGKVIYLLYTHSTGNLSSASIVNLGYVQYLNLEMKNNFQSLSSPLGCERFLGSVSGISTYDGKMSQYEGYTFVWSNPNGDIFTYTFDTSVDTVRVRGGESYGDPMYVVINSPESLNLEIMRFNDNGTVDITSLGTEYADWNGYLQYGALGDKTWISWKDTSRALPDNKIQSFAVFAGGTGPVDQLWMTTNNNGDQIGRNQFISQFDESVTYLFNYSGNAYYTITDLISSWTQFRYNSYQDPINFEVLSNVAATLFPTYDSSLLINPNFQPPVRIDGPILEFRGSSNYAVRLVDSGINGGLIRIDVFNYEGTLVNSVLTQSNTYADFQVVGDRIFLLQNSQSVDNTYHLYLITANTYQVKDITTYAGYNYSINDWRWWD